MLFFFILFLNTYFWGFLALRNWGCIIVTLGVVYSIYREKDKTCEIRAFSHLGEKGLTALVADRDTSKLLAESC